MINVMDMVYIHIMMVLFIKEIGLMINKMDMVWKNIQMELFIEVNLKIQ